MVSLGFPKMFGIVHQISMVFLRFSYNFGDFCKFDSRPALGLPHTTKDMDKVKAANDADKNATYRQKDIDFPELDKEEVPYENREEK